MPYVRKTEDEYDIEQHTACGWEIVHCETTSRAARQSIKEYRANQPGSYRIRKHRVRKEARQ